MRSITASQLRARLGEALDRASAGERIIIERDHQPIAAIVPIEDAQQLDGQSAEAIRRRLAAMERIRERAERLRRPESEAPDDATDAAVLVRWDRDHGHDDVA